MKNFMIGQYGHFDHNKLKRDYREGFYGIEACLMKSEEDVIALRTETIKNNTNVGIHFPLRAGIFTSRDPLFMDRDADVRNQAYRDIEEELSYISDIGLKPRYILFHFPKPVILNDNFDLNRWKFASR